MSFAPVRLGNTVLEAETAAADRKSCRRFGPCGVGEKALYLNDLLIDRHFYVGFGSVRRVFKRVAMSQGGFSGKGAFGSIPYLVVQYDDGQEKQCTFKREEDVDELLAYLGQVHPEIPRLSVGGEQRLAKKAQQEASRYLKELTPQAQSVREELERARKFLSGYPELTAQLAAAAKAKRAYESRLPLGRAGDRPRGRGGIGVRHHLVARRQRFRRLLRALRLCRRVFLLGSARSAHGKE